MGWSHLLPSRGGPFLLRLVARGAKGPVTRRGEASPRAEPSADNVSCVATAVLSTIIDLTEPIATARLRNLRLAGEPLGSAAEVVGWLGAVQAQDYGPAKWSVGQRSVGLRDGDVERAFNAGEILRTHVLRPTWHGCRR